MTARRRDERGVTAAIVAVLMSSVLFISAAFAVDLGLQRDSRRDAQAVADVVALDLARMLDGRPADQYDDATMDDAMADSVKRNSAIIGEDLSPSDVTWTFATWNATTSSWDTVAKDATTVPGAVKVVTRTNVGFAFGGFTGVHSGGAVRSAVASSADPTVCFSVGTRTLTLNTAQSALSPLLKNILDVNLSAVGYDGIVGLTNVSVPLADLMVGLGVGSYDEFLSTDVSLADFILAAADALQANGDTVDANVLKGIKIGVQDARVKLADILNLESGADPSALTADLNVFDILSAAIVAANGQHAVAANIPGVADLTVIEPPVPACGSKNVVAHSAQIRATIAPTLVTSTLNALGLASAKVKLTLEVGAGTATLKTIGCGPKRATLDVHTGAATLNGILDLAITLSKIPGLGAVLGAALKLLGIDPLGFEADLGATVAGSDYPDRTVDFPDPPALPDPLVVPDKNAVSQTLSISGTNIRSTNESLLGSLLNPVLGLVVPLVANTIVPALDSTVLTPLVNTLLSTLGIKLGVAEVDMLDNVNCDNVKLVG